MRAIRVTEVLDYFKEPWYTNWVVRVGKREGNRVSKAALKVGTRVDEYIKTYAKGELGSAKRKEKPEVESCLQAFEKWEKVYQPASIKPCTRLFATIDGIEVTGEPDLMIDDVLVDIKTSKHIDIKMWVQVNMYQYLSEMRSAYIGLTPPKVGILRLDKTTASYEYVVKDYDPSLVNVWCGMLRAFVVFNKEALDGGSELREDKEDEALA